MSDTALRVRQIGNYGEVDQALGTDMLLMQRGGTGGGMFRITPANLVETALAGAGAFGVGFIVPEDAVSTIFSRATSFPLGGGPLWNAYPNGGLRAWMAGLAGRVLFDAQGHFRAQIAPWRPAGALQPAWSDLLAITPAGDATLPRGTLTVARDPVHVRDVATRGWVSRSTVKSIMGRSGAVLLTPGDIYQALGLNPKDPIATSSATEAAICRAIQQLLHKYPAVWSFNGRVRDIFLRASDVIEALEKGGIILPTPPPQPDPTLPPNTITIPDETTVNNIVNEILTGPDAGGPYATESWVQGLIESSVAGVASFNGRTGVVGLTLGDITTAGGAPISSPNLLDQPTAPTPPLDDHSNRIATTQFFFDNLLARNVRVTPAILGQTSLQGILQTLADIVASAMVQFTGDINAVVQPAAIAGATVVLQGDLSGTATDLTGAATGIQFTGDVVT